MVLQPFMKLKILAITVVFLVHLAQSQLNPAFTQRPINGSSGVVTGTNIFYLDSNSDCNGPVRELFLSTATIKGTDVSNKRQVPTTCTIRLESTGQYDSTLLDIQVKSMNIQDCTTQVSIYDGDGAQRLMMSYDCRSSQNSNRMSFITSGNVATFMMARQNTLNVNFDIEIVVTPVRGGVNPGGETTLGPNYFDKFSQMAIVGMIGAFYALILAICTAIIVYCGRSYWGYNKQWETHQLATVKTGTTFETKTPPSNIWSVEMKQRQGAVGQYSRGSTFPNPRTNVVPSEDGDSGVYYNEDKFQKRRLVNDERDKAKPQYITSNASFLGPEVVKDHRKTATSEAKPGNRRNKLPPSYKDVVDHTADESSDGESQVSSNGSGTKQSWSSEEERSERSSMSNSETPSNTESEEESGESDDDHSSRDHRARAGKQKRPPNKSKRRGSDSVTGQTRPNQLQHQLLPPPPQLQQIPYGAYPSAQFISVMAGHPQFQPVHMVPGYPPPVHQEHSAALPQVQPTEPPIYSYLVRRGYTPLEAHRNSPAGPGSQHSDGSNLQEPDLRLDSGVEYMRR